MMPKAIIICRVSSKRQEKEGHGLESQETLCREYCKRQGYDVIRVFHDTYTGGGNFWNRPALKEALDYLLQENDEYIMVFDDLKRFARDIEFHIQLRKQLQSYGARPECVTFEFKDTPEGRLVEHMLAATNQYEREANAIQVRRRMQARFKNGYWVFRGIPKGYQYADTAEHGKLLVPKPHEWDIVQKCRIDFAKGRLSTKSSVARYLKTNGVNFNSNTVDEFLLNPIPSGWLVCKKWNMRVKGKHKPMHSEQVQQQIEKRLAAMKKTFIRKDSRSEFPLRGDLLCGCCNAKMTASWSSGRKGARYRYYHCSTPRCVRFNGDKLEGAFMDRLSMIQFPKGMLNALEGLLFEEAEKLEKKREQIESYYKKQEAEHQTKIDNLTEAIADTSNPEIRKRYQQKIETLMTKQAAFSRASVDHLLTTAQNGFEKGKIVLKDPPQYWEYGKLHERKIAQEMLFQLPIMCKPEILCRNAEFSFVVRHFEDSESSNCCGGQGLQKLEMLFKEQREQFLAELHRWNDLFLGHLD